MSELATIAMNVAVIIPGGTNTIPLQATVGFTGSSGFADLLDSQLEATGRPNLLPPPEESGIAFDAGLLLQGPELAGANEGNLLSKPVNAVTSSLSSFQVNTALTNPQLAAGLARLEVNAVSLSPDAAPESAAEADRASTSVLYTALRVPLHQSAIGQAMAQTTGAAGLFLSANDLPIALNNSAMTIVALPDESDGANVQLGSFAGPSPGINNSGSLSELPESPGNRTALPTVPGEATLQRQSSSSLSLIETETGPIIAYFAPQDMASLPEIKAIAETLMAEYSIPAGQLVYKAALTSLGAALGGSLK